MVRPGRNWVQHKCDQLDNLCNNQLEHLRQMHELYYYGQTAGSFQITRDPVTNEEKTDPQYPEHVEFVENISALVISVQEIIKQFKTEHV